MTFKKTNEQPSPENKGPGVSELLRTTRERAGEELQTVSQVLRIRHVYLQAIEDGRYEDLPGKTYVVGFVRAYAEHLGLDVEEVVNRFKQEVDGLEAKADLIFPSPATEQSVPGGAIILISLVVIGVVYGGWYFLSSQDRDIAELVPDLPAKFAEMVKDEPAVETVTNEPPLQATPQGSDEPVEAEEDVKPEDAGEMAAAALEAVENTEEKTEEVSVETVVVETEEAANAVAEGQNEPEPEETIAETVASAIETVEEQVEAVIQTEQAAAEPEEVVEETPSATEETANETTEPVVEAEDTQEVATPAEAPVEEAPVETAEVVEEETTIEATIPAEMNSKIVLKAVDYSWIQIVQTDGKVVHTQALNQGDEFETPREAGLILRTGNAGGLEIYVDDEKVPSIGEFGEVRRRVIMDPARLKSGRAVER